MCYTGKGRFEDGMGECGVYSFKKFKTEMGVNSCLVCTGNRFDPFEHPIVERAAPYTEEELDNMAKEARIKKLVF